MTERAGDSALDMRKRALRRAGGAVLAAVVLLIAVLMLEDGKDVPPAPAASPLRPAQLQPESERSDVSAAPLSPQPPNSGQAGAAAEGMVVAESSLSQPAPAVPVCPEPAPPVAEKKPPSPPLGNGYLVQLGVFTAMENADDLRADLIARGFPAHVDGRVVLGPYPNKAAAEAARQRLKREGGPAGIIVPPRKGK